MTTKAILRSNKNQAIRVCTGPGCKGWGSEHLLQELQASCPSPDGGGRRICSSRCFNRCGGGATVVVGSRKGSVLKFKDTLQALARLTMRLPTSA